RRRAAVSLSMSAAASGDPITQLDWVVETFQQVNQALSKTALGRSELIALGGLLAQISGALLVLTDQLSAATQHYDRTQAHRPWASGAGPSRCVTAGSALQGCREGIRATYLAAQAFRADLK
ncbi:MAG TPA: hypothetical protein VFO16_07425, partial [Pseudonocardiaceae bacterium]|nr:hypothetical protein [Pseudonocardiaceae bacterium]